MTNMLWQSFLPGDTGFCNWGARSCTASQGLYRCQQVLGLPPEHNKQLAPLFLLGSCAFPSRGPRLLSTDAALQLLPTIALSLWCTALTSSENIRSGSGFTHPSIFVLLLNEWGKKKGCFVETVGTKTRDLKSIRSTTVTRSCVSPWAGKGKDRIWGNRQQLGNRNPLEVVPKAQDTSPFELQHH